MQEQLSPGRRGPRALRAVGAALVATTVAVTFHGFAGGAGSWIAVAISLVLTSWVAMMLAGRRFGYPGLGLILALAQGLVHLTMEMFSGLPVLLAACHGNTLFTFAGGPVDHAAHSGHGTGGGLPMLAAHVVATLITLLLLKHGEDAGYSLLATLFAQLFALVLHLVRALPEVRRTHTGTRPARPVTVAVLNACYRRGPPVPAH